LTINLYLISPLKIQKDFYNNLDKILTSKKVKYFQLRLKKYPVSKIFKIARIIKKITKKHNVKFIINDSAIIANKIGADGCHLGQSDGSIKNAKKLLRKGKIIGITCHGSKNLILKAIKEKPSYIALGSFFKSKLKPKAKKAQKRLIAWTKKRTTIPIVAIGGINDKNYKSLVKLGANYLAISSYIWNKPRGKLYRSVKKFV
jgi:thiamine-phosphate pyrophosphorylase